MTLTFKVPLSTTTGFINNSSVFLMIPQTLVGTSGNETLVGGNGNDTIYGSFGDDRLEGGGGDDVISARRPDIPMGTVANWGQDVVLGGDGNDTIDFRDSRDPVKVYGDGLVPWKYDGTDLIMTGSGNDTVFGGGGKDTIVTYEGADRIDAGPGNDIIIAGPGADIITTGDGRDDIVVRLGDSGIKYYTVDTITDFDARFDRISTGYSANRLDPSDYREIDAAQLYRKATGLPMTDFTNALSAAKSYSAENGYTFVTNQVDGFLFMDLDGNYGWDTAIILKGVQSLSGFGPENLFI